MALSKPAIATIIIAIAIAGIAGTLGALTASHTVPSSGSVTVTAVGVGVYNNSACTNVISTISWGTITNGSAPTKLIYIENTGNTQETLSMTTSGWNPSTAPTYISLSWNATGTAVSAGSHVAALLTLTVSGGITGITSFSFNMTITGTH
jgi:hypothetical protein